MAAQRSAIHLATACGRQLRIGHLPLDGLPGGGRVTVTASCAAFDRGQLWMTLTAPEARQLAAALLLESAALEDWHGAAPRAGRTAAGPAQPTRLAST